MLVFTGHYLSEENTEKEEFPFIDILHRLKSKAYGYNCIYGTREFFQKLQQQAFSSTSLFFSVGYFHDTKQ